jgi:mRNA interferase MazF
MPLPMKSRNLGQFPQRGEVWWVRLDPVRGGEIRKTRPGLVVTANALNQDRKTVIVIPLSSSPLAAPPVLVPVKCSGQDGVAVTDQIRAVANERFMRRLDVIPADQFRQIEDAVRRILEL